MQKQLETAIKKAQYYEKLYNDTLTEIRELKKVTPLKNSIVVPIKNISLKLDEIIEVKLKDTFGVEKTIVSSPSEIIILKPKQSETK